MTTTYNALSWFVMYHNCNADRIEKYDILKHEIDLIKKLKKKSQNKEEFAEKLLAEMMRAYWSKAEWELIIELDDTGRVWLSPWVGSRHPEDTRINITVDSDFDWVGFAEQRTRKYDNYENLVEKIDVFDQLEYRWEDFVNYCWYTRMKYERKNSKFED